MSFDAGGVPSNTPAYYSIDMGDIHIVCLDSYLSDVSTAGPQATWLRQDLSALQVNTLKLKSLG
jgi:hypothetical protein